MQLTTLLLLLSSLSSLALANPIHRDVGIENCTTIATGLLSGGATADHPQSFRLTAGRHGVLKYGGRRRGGLEVAFQRCDPNFADFPQNSSLISGHIYVPSRNRCLSVQDQAGSPPHTVSLDKCAISDDSSQIFQSFLRLNQTGEGVTYVFGGFTDDRGNKQNAANCSDGLLGYAGPADLADPPTKGTVEIVCLQSENALPFRIIPQ